MTLAWPQYTPSACPDYNNGCLVPACLVLTRMSRYSVHCGEPVESENGRALIAQPSSFARRQKAFGTAFGPAWPKSSRLGPPISRLLTRLAGGFRIRISRLSTARVSPSCSASELSEPHLSTMISRCFDTGATGSGLLRSSANRHRFRLGCFVLPRTHGTLHPCCKYQALVASLLRGAD